MMFDHCIGPVDVLCVDNVTYLLWAHHIVGINSQFGIQFSISLDYFSHSACPSLILSDFEINLPFCLFGVKMLTSFPTCIFGANLHLINHWESRVSNKSRWIEMEGNICLR